nr:flagellar biosynthetic protein FliO [Bartonella ancashensis]
MAVDRVRRLILVRRDDVEHLILIGGTTDIVVESDTKKTKIPHKERHMP